MAAEAVAGLMVADRTGHVVRKASPANGTSASTPATMSKRMGCS